MFVLLTGAAGRAKERPVFDESIESERSFSLFGGPTKEGPEAEWANVQKAVERGKLKRAIRHTEYLVTTWPDHALAVDALRLQGDLYFAREQFQEAFQSYQELIDSFAGRFDYEAVLRQQLEAARKQEDKVYKALFGLNSFQRPTMAIPMYRQLLTNAPQMKEAPQILFDIAEIYHRKKNFNEAIQEYRILEQRYPNHPLAENAVLRMAEAFTARAERYPTDIRPLEGALDTLTYFKARFPESARMPEVRLSQKEVYDRMAKIRFEQAKFYEENLQRPQAALVGYRALLEQFPDSEWTVPARDRILDLSDKER
jgi:outer membrane protein assembly factor BamD